MVGVDSVVEAEEAVAMAEGAAEEDVPEVQLVVVVKVTAQQGEGRGRLRSVTNTMEAQGFGMVSQTYPARTKSSLPSPLPLQGVGGYTLP